MNFIQAYPACACGVVLSIIIPVLIKAVKTVSEQWMTTVSLGIRSLDSPVERVVAAIKSSFRVMWPVLRPYVVVGVFSLAVSVLIVAFLGDKLKTWESALIAGYVWDSTLQKITGKS
jgi:hypothetical protein